MRKHSEILTEIAQLLNTKRGKDTAQNFKRCLKELAKNYNTTLSTKFLRNLVNSEKNNRQKTFRIRYLLRQSGLKTKRQNRYFKGEDNKIRKIDIKEFGFSDLSKIDLKRLNAQELNQIEKFKPYEMTQEEKIQLQEIKEIKEKSDIDLFNYPQASFNARENKRKWVYFYPNQLITLKAIRTQEILNTFKIHQKEVLFFIEGF